MDNTISTIDRSWQLENCSFIKAMLMLFVILDHSNAVFTGQWFTNLVNESVILGYVSKYLGHFHVYAFTLVSGYIFCYLRFENKHYNDKKAFIVNKIKRLIVPYVIVAAFWVVPWYIYYYEVSALEIIKKFVLASSPSQLWFLWMLFWVFIIAIILPDMVYDNDYHILGISLILFAFGSLGIIPSFFQISRAFQFFIYFSIGIILRKHLGKTRLNKIGVGGYLTLDLILFIASVALDSFSGMFFKVLGSAVQLLLHCVGSIAAFYVLDKIANTFNWKENKAISLICKYNFTIYLFHQQLIYITITWFNGKVPNILLVVINFSFSLIVSFLIAIVVDKAKMQITRHDIVSGTRRFVSII